MVFTSSDKWYFPFKHRLRKTRLPLRIFRLVVNKSVDLVGPSIDSDTINMATSVRDDFCLFYCIIYYASLLIFKRSFTVIITMLIYHLKKMFFWKLKYHTDRKFYWNMSVSVYMSWNLNIKWLKPLSHILIHVYLIIVLPSCHK